MSDSPSDTSSATGGPADLYVRQPNGRTRPVSPHLTHWRWHVTMLASILFRVTIGAASVGLLFVLAWLLALAMGPQAHAAFMACATSPLGLVVGIGLTLVLFSFVLNGARHLINDTGAALTLKPANTLSLMMVWGPLVLTALFWAGLFATGRVAL